MGTRRWIAAHNSYLNIIYRAGVIGLFALLAVFVILFKNDQKIYTMPVFNRSFTLRIIINWFAAANFLLILELPYTAIPVWTLFGLTYAYVSTVRPSEAKP